MDLNGTHKNLIRVTTGVRCAMRNAGGAACRSRALQVVLSDYATAPLGPPGLFWPTMHNRAATLYARANTARTRDHPKLTHLSATVAKRHHHGAAYAPPPRRNTFGTPFLHKSKQAAELCAGRPGGSRGGEHVSPRTCGILTVDATVSPVLLGSRFETKINQVGPLAQ
jgi:hypothetical protein